MEKVRYQEYAGLVLILSLYAIAWGAYASFTPMLDMSPVFQGMLQLLPNTVWGAGLIAAGMTSIIGLFSRKVGTLRFGLMMATIIFSTITAGYVATAPLHPSTVGSFFVVALLYYCHIKYTRANVPRKALKSEGVGE